jgi:hypothetical protein
MAARRRGGGLTVDHQHLHLRERLGTTTWHHLRQPDPVTRRQIDSLVKSTECRAPDGPEADSARPAGQDPPAYHVRLMFA